MPMPPSPTESLMARRPIAPPNPQTGVTPQLLDLLAKVKVQKDTEAAQRQLAMAAGQLPPTVADTVEQSALTSARQEISQKLGLPGIQQAQQQPQQPGAQQAPQAAPQQGMAEGGLTKLGSNLPKAYAGGGIVAFEEGGAALIPREGDGPTPGAVEEEGAVGLLIRMGLSPEAARNIANMTNAAGPLGRGVKAAGTGVGMISKLLRGAGDTAQAVATARNTMEDRRGPMQEASYSNEGRNATQVMPDKPSVAAQEDVKGLPAIQRLGASARTSGSSRAPTPAPAAAPAAPAGGDMDYIREAIKRDVNADPEAIRAARITRQQQELGGPEEAYRAALRQNMERQQALDDRQLKDSKPNWATWASQFDPTAPTFGAGVGNKMAGIQAAYRKQEQEAAARRGTSEQQLAAQQLADIKGRYAYGDSAATAAGATREKGIAQGTNILNTAETNATSRANNAASNATSLQVANIQAAANRYAADLREKMQEAAEKRTDIRGLTSEIMAAEATLKRLSPQALMMITDPSEKKAAQEEIGRAMAVREANRKRLSSLTGVEYKDTGSGPTIDTALWGQPKARN